MVLRTHLQAEHRLFVDGALTINAAVEAAKRPINEDDLHRIERASSQGALQGAHHHAVWFVAEQARKPWRLLASAPARTFATRRGPTGGCATSRFGCERPPSRLVPPSQAPSAPRMGQHGTEQPVPPDTSLQADRLEP
jgi:hypothetical protein